MLLYTKLNYDKRGCLYRSIVITSGFLPEMGIYNMTQNLNIDRLDTHIFFTQTYQYPAIWLTRGDISLGVMIKATVGLQIVSEWLRGRLQSTEVSSPSPADIIY
jgi:hypothetical protein